MRSEPESTYAWLRLAAALALMTLGGSGMYGIAVALSPVQAEFGVTRGDASLPYTLTMIGFGIGGILMGRIADRFGVVVPVAIGALGLGGGFVVAGTSSSLLQFSLAHGVLIGFFGCSATFAPLVADTSLWFNRRRGIAVAICASGNYLAGAVWPPILQYSFDTIGWRATYVGTGVFCTAAMLLLALALRRRPPALGSTETKLVVRSDKPLGQEEIGLRGARTSAFGIDPHIGIAVDVTHATDCPTIEKKQQGEISLGKGPVIFRGPNMNPVVVERLIDTCTAKEIPYQLAAVGRATNGSWGPSTARPSRPGSAKPFCPTCTPFRPGQAARPASDVTVVGVHAVTDAPPIRLVVAETGETLAWELRFGQASAPYALAPGLYHVEARRASDDASVMTKPLSSNDRPLALRLRPDLVVVPVEMSGTKTWVVKDPLTLEHFQLSDEEYALADLLRQRLQQTMAAETGHAQSRPLARELHIRASQWYEDNGLELEAFQHAAAANDVERAERLMDGKTIPRHFRGGVTPMLDWLDSLPKTVLDARPSLWWRHAGLLLINGQTVGVGEKLQAAEDAIAALWQGAEPDEKTRNLLGQIAGAKATLALTRYDVETMLTQSRRALEYLHPGSLFSRSAAYWTLGSAYLLQGDRAAARQAPGPAPERSPIKVEAPRPGLQPKGPQPFSCNRAFHLY